LDISGVIAKRAFAITLVTALVSAFFYSTGEAVSVLAGGLVAVANFRLMARFLKRTIAPGLDPGAGRALGFASFLVRYALLGAVLLLIIRSIASPVFFIIGLTSVVAAVFTTHNELKRAGQ